MEFVRDYEKTAIFFRDKEYTYKDLIQGAKYYSTLLDLEKGKRAVVFSENRPEIAFSVFAIWEKNGVSINADGGYSSEELAYVLSDSDPKYIFTSEKNYDTALEAKRLSDSHVKIIKFEDVIIPENFQVENWVLSSPEKEEVAVILYTSGTTGNPKGVMLTVGNIMSNLDALKKIKLYDENDRFLALLPYHHVFPLVINLFAPFHNGSMVVMLDEISSETIREALQKYKITIMIGVPRLWELLHKGIMNKINSSKAALYLFRTCEKIKFEWLRKKIFKKVHDAFGGSMRIMASGGAKLDPDIMKNLTTLGFKMLEGYGLTETSPIITFNNPDDARMGSAGVPIPGVEVKISDDGEVLARGLNVMKGYLNRPETTSQVIDSDGWFHTGDLGELRDGHLYLIGRKKEMIVLSNGKNINPADIEIEIMKDAKLIKEMAVTEYNKHLVAIVYPDFEAIKEANITNIKETLKWEIIDKYNVTAPKYRKILEIKIVKEELPKTKLGKLRRFKLSELIEGSEDKQEEKTDKKVSEELQTNEYKKIEKYLKENHGVDVTPESHLELDLGLDSLDLVEILSFIENSFGVEIQEDEFVNIGSIEDLCKFIREKGGEYREGDINWNTILNKDIEVDLPKSAIASKIFKLLTAPIFKFRLSLEKTGMENIPDTPCIFAGNHQSLADGFAFNQALSNKRLEKTYYLATVVQFKTPLKIFLAKRGNVVIVDINKNLKETLQIAAKVLKSGKNLVIFPEGARTRDGEIQEFKKSFAILSKELNIPIVPFGIDGAYEAMPYGKSFPQRGKMRLNFFPAVDPEGKELEEIINETKDTIDKWIKKS
ncbi:AMP-binding protein [Ilyobacter polytropus]|uniref:AMP-dependent synthetase and ligase n=1 Tax=Ilyobacter polytropus (strain ATCC 51220 / DSM 2926 / LMG 16218 / CuHBu1) TaxID=572544 RepID=E3HC90_ILYPC|nr:AMP-binding protein [Ilyobacter polytropus]ADO83933.1 AMP-dependent synthetase and ligase [Ilyobacter polytropus DSM 2926]